jgi:adenylate cyclase
MVGTRKIAAILVADVVGYSRLAAADEDRTLSRLTGLRSDLIDPAIDAHRGRIVKRTGDGSLIEFSQRGRRRALRDRGSDWHGRAQRRAAAEAPHRVSRRHSSWRRRRGGGWRSDGRWRQHRRAPRRDRQSRRDMPLRGRLPPGERQLDMAVADLGPTQLKNIERPIRVYSLQVGVPAQAKPSAEAKPSEKPPGRGPGWPAAAF